MTEKLCQHADPSLGCHPKAPGNPACGRPAWIVREEGFGFCKECFEAIEKQSNSQGVLPSNEAMAIAVKKGWLAGPNKKGEYTVTPKGAREWSEVLRTIREINNRALTPPKT